MMIKADLVTVLRTQEGVSSREAVAAVEGVLAVLKEALQTGEPVRLAHFGTFNVRATAERVGRNPATGHWLMLAPRKVVTFRPSRLLRDLVDQGQTP
jgi:integration host factor subunit alpha